MPAQRTTPENRRCTLTAALNQDQNTKVSKTERPRESWQVLDKVPRALEERPGQSEIIKVQYRALNGHLSSLRRNDLEIHVGTALQESYGVKISNIRIKDQLSKDIRRMKTLRDGRTRQIWSLPLYVQRPAEEGFGEDMREARSWVLSVFLQAGQLELSRSVDLSPDL